MNEELLKKLNGLVAKIKSDLIVDAVLDLGDIYAVSTREKNMNSDEMFIDGWYAADKQASKIMPFDKQKYQKKFASALKNPLWDINSAGKEIKHSMGYNLVDKNQNDGVLAHASKYAGGFTKDGDNTPEYNHNYYIENREKILAKRRQRRDTAKAQASGSKPSAKPNLSPSNFVKTNRGERPIGNGVHKTSGAPRTRSGGATRSMSKGPDRVNTRNAQVENYIASTKKHRTSTNSLSDIEKAKKKKSGIENAKNFINGLLSKAGKAADEAGRNISKAAGKAAKDAAWTARKASWAIADSAPVQATKKAIKDAKNKADIKSGKKTRAEAYGWQDYAVGLQSTKPRVDKDGRVHYLRERKYRDMSEYERDIAKGYLNGNNDSYIVGHNPKTGEQKKYYSREGYNAARQLHNTAGSEAHQRQVRNRGSWTAISSYRDENGKWHDRTKRFDNYQEYLKAIEKGDYSPMYNSYEDGHASDSSKPVHYDLSKPETWPENKKNKKRTK